MLARVLLTTLALVPPCLWDSDTVDDELRGLPDAHRLLTGRWSRHGRAYYEDRVSRLGRRADLALDEYDDLGVAYERLGQRDLALEVMEAKRAALELLPHETHSYRYHANKGTFLAHGGELEAAIEELERAVAINPSAHFGRERYQIELIRYIAAARNAPDVWAKDNLFTFMGMDISRRIGPSIEFPVDRGAWVNREPPFDFNWDKAYTALSGMLRYGGLEGPELYRSLGDLHEQRGQMNLAWWAWQRSLERGHPAPEPIRAAIARVEDHWRHHSGYGRFASFIPPDLDDYRRLRENADRWLATFQAAEERALANGEDPGRAEVLERLVAYADSEVPEITLDQTFHWGRWLLALPFAIWAAVRLVSWTVRRRRREAWARRRRAAGQAAVTPPGAGRAA